MQRTDIDYNYHPSVYADMCNEDYADDERGLRGIKRILDGPKHIGEYAPLSQRELWAQIRFGYRLIDTNAKFEWWVEYIRTHCEDGASAPLIHRTEGKCSLYMCFFEFRDIPCIVVPLYRNRRVGMAQGIVKFEHAAGFNGIHRSLFYNHTMPTMGGDDDMPNQLQHLGVSLIAAVCRNMNIDLLFASPIKFFRVQILLFIEAHRIKHWIGDDCNLTSGGVGIDKSKHQDFPHWCSTPPSNRIYHIRLRQNPIGFGKGDERADLGRFVTEEPEIVPWWDIVNQKWVINSDNAALSVALRSGELDAYIDTHFVYNFLQQLAGDGIIIMLASDMAHYYCYSHASLALGPEPQDTFLHD
jgi:hypothetical protein